MNIQEDFHKTVFVNLPPVIIDKVLYGEDLPDSEIREWVERNRDKFEGKIVCLLHERAELFELNSPTGISSQVIVDDEGFSELPEIEQVKAFVSFSGTEARQKSSAQERREFLQDNFGFEIEKLRELVVQVRSRAIDLIKNIADDVLVADQGALNTISNKSVYAGIAGLAGYVMKRNHTGQDSARYFSSGEHQVEEMVASGGTIAENLSGVPCLVDIWEDLSLKQALKYLLDGAKGCVGLHDKGFAHNDFKPDQIMVHGGVGKLNDFELFTGMDEPAFSGTPVFTPEFYRFPALDVLRVLPVSGVADRDKGASRDVFAFGIALLKTYRTCTKEQIGVLNLLDFIRNLKNAVQMSIIDNAWDCISKDKSIIREFQGYFGDNSGLKYFRNIFLKPSEEDMDKYKGAVIQVLFRGGLWSPTIDQLRGGESVAQDLTDYIISCYDNAFFEIVDCDKIAEEMAKFMNDPMNPIPKELRPLVLRMLDLRPEMRPTMQEAIDEIERY